MVAKCDALKIILQVAIYYGVIGSTAAVLAIDKESPQTCISKSDASQHYFFDIAQLQCLPCAQVASFQVVSADGLRCVCKDGHYLLKNYGGKEILCAACANNQVTSGDGWGCVDCILDDKRENCLSSCSGQNVITVERLVNGNWKNNVSKQFCQTCATKTTPNSARNRCERCSQVLSMLPNQTQCDCPELQAVGGLCFGNPRDILSRQIDSMYVVKFADQTLRSAYFKDHLLSADAMCNDKYGNLTACQLLGNLCVLLLYAKSGGAENACSLYSSGSTTGRASQEWPTNKPWLYYLKDTPATLLSDTSLRRVFTFPDDRLRLFAARYSVDGEFLGSGPVEGGTLQLCGNTKAFLNAALNFGTSYQQTCMLSVKDFWDATKHPLIFYDLFIEETQSDKSQLYPIPILIEQYGSNSGGDETSWQFVRRLFLVDNVSGRPASDSGDGGMAAPPQAIRYARSITLQVALQSGTRDGHVYIPTLHISYATANLAEFDADKQVEVTFSVEYSMDLSAYRRSLSVAAGVLCALAILHALLRTWGWSKRAGKVAIDIVTIVKFIVFVCAGIANVFFVVCAGVALWWLIFYKRQHTVYLMVPRAEEEREFITYLVVSLVLKGIQLLHMIIAQSSIDIFFIDWERPRGGASNGGGGAGAEGGAAGGVVSIWRTYFAANEWNEIQTARKINDALQVFAVVFFLDVVGFEGVASRSPLSDFSPTPGAYAAPDSRIFRFAIIVLVYLTIAVVQWVFYTFIYERFLEDRVRQYVDLCSMCNVSVFVLENAHFGYYIHGRSVHGAADTGMRQMHENLRREEEDLCGQRGLQPNTQQQTFMMAIPSRLRAQYDGVMMPANRAQQGAMPAVTPGSKSSPMDPKMASSIHAYSVINRFLQVFIDHSLRDVDYTIKDRTLLESILDVEFEDATEKGIFYNDNSHSFDAVLFFGNETTLIIFELLVFAIFDLMSGSFVLAGVATYVVMHLINIVRDSLGKANIVKKTLVDKRFLI